MVYRGVGVSIKGPKRLGGIKGGLLRVGFEV